MAQFSDRNCGLFRILVGETEIKIGLCCRFGLPEVLREFCCKIGVKELAHHRLRATHITLALADDVPLAIVKEDFDYPLQISFWNLEIFF